MTDQTEVAFDSDGMQTTVIDRNGNNWTYLYGPNNELESINGPTGMTSIDYSGDEVTITDPGDRVTTLTLEGGNLVTITAPDGSSQQHAYDDNHRIVEETDERGMTWTFDRNEAGRISAVTSPDSGTYHFEPLQSQDFDPNTLDPMSAPMAYTATDSAAAIVIDPNGNVIQENLDAAGQSTGSVDEVGQGTRVIRNGQNLVRQTFDGRGNGTFFDYNERGLVTRIIDEASAPDWISDSIASPGQRNEYRFRVDQAVGVYTFDAQVGGADIAWSLYADGTDEPIVLNRPFNESDGQALRNDQDFVHVLSRGEYTIHIHATDRFAEDDDATGSYTFRMLSLNNSLPLEIGETITGRRHSRIPTIYSFEAAANDNIFVDVTYDEATQASIALVGPQGRVIQRVPLNADLGEAAAPIVAPTAGTYYVVADFVGTVNTEEFTVAVYTAQPQTREMTVRP